MMRRILAGLVITAMALAVVARAENPVIPKVDPKSNTDKKADELTADQLKAAVEEAKLKQEQLSRRFRDFEGALLRLKQRLETSPRAEDREKAATLGRALERVNSDNIDSKFDKLVKDLATEKGITPDYLEKVKNQNKELADDIRAIVAILMSDNRDEELRREKDRITELLKRLNELIRSQQTVRAWTERDLPKDKLVKGQKDVGDDTKDFAKGLNKDGKDGKDGDAKKSEAKGEGTKKDNGNKGDAKDDTKDNKGGNKGPEGEKKPNDGDKPKDGQEPKGGAKGEGKPPMDGDKDNKGDAKGEGKPMDADAKGNGKPMDGNGKDDPKGGAKGDGKPMEGNKENKGDSKGDGKPNDGNKPPMDGNKDSKPGEGKPDGKEGGKPSNPSDKAGGKEGGKPMDGSKPGEGKGDGKPSDMKPGDSKPGQGDSKSKGDGKGEGKGSPSPGKPMEGKPGEGKGGDGKPGQPGQPGSSKGGGGQSPPGGNQPPMPPMPEKDGYPGRKQVEDAAKNQEDAKKKLEDEKNNDAGKDQNDAIKNLKEAQKKLEELLRQLREEEVERLLAALQARCEKMRAMQIEVRDGTVATYKVVQTNDDKKPTRNEVIRSGQLGEREDEIVTEATKAITLLEQEGSAVAFAEVFTQVRTDMMNVSRRLRNTDVNLVTQTIENDIIATLDEMIEALKKAQKDQQAKKQQGQPGQPSNGPKPNDPLLDMIAELKMVRSMQLRVNNRTKTYGQEYPGLEQTPAVDPKLPDEQRKKLEDVHTEFKDLSNRQEKIVDIVKNLQKGKNQ